MSSVIENVIYQVESEHRTAKKFLLLGLYASGFSVLIIIFGKLSIAPNTVTLPYINIPVPIGYTFFALLIVSVIMGWLSVYYLYQSNRTLKLASTMSGTVSHDEAANFTSRLMLAMKPIDNLKVFCIAHYIYIIGIWGWSTYSLTENVLVWVLQITIPIIPMSPYFWVVIYKPNQT